MQIYTPVNLALMIESIRQRLVTPPMKNDMASYMGLSILSCFMIVVEELRDAFRTLHKAFV